MKERENCDGCQWEAAAGRPAIEVEKFRLGRDLFLVMSVRTGLGAHQSSYRMTTGVSVFGGEAN
jgi:hypothetical protein